MAAVRRVFIRIVELLICIGCIALHTQSYTGDNHTEWLSRGTFVGFLIILTGAVVGHFLSSGFDKKVDLFFCLAGCACFIAAGALNIEYFHNAYKSDMKNYGLAKGSLAIINGAIFLFDAFRSYRGDA